MTESQNLYEKKEARSQKRLFLCLKISDRQVDKLDVWMDG